MSLTDTVGILLGVSGLVVAGAVFVFRAGTVVDELAGAHDEVRRLRRRFPEAWLRWAFRALGTLLALIGVSFGYVALRPSDPIRSFLWTVLTIGVLLFVAAGGVGLMYRPRTFIDNVPESISPTLKFLDRRLPDETTERITRAFGAFTLLSVLFFLYILFVY